jgi:predicted nucleic acid-binding protein
MILVDTSVWIDHLRKGDERLIRALGANQVLMHPFIEGELACGNLRNRGEILALLSDLPRAIIASEEEVLFFIERHGLMGQGIGYIDAHLLAATSLEDSARLWTRDKRLLGIAQDLGLKHEHD